eukprot:490043_1
MTTRRRTSKRLASKSTAQKQSATNQATSRKYTPYTVVKWPNGPTNAHWNCSCNRSLRNTASTANAFKCQFCEENYGHDKCYQHEDTNNTDFKICFACMNIHSDMDKQTYQDSIQIASETKTTETEADTNITKETFSFPELDALQEGPNMILLQKVYNSEAVENVQVIKVTNGDVEENQLFIQYKDYEQITIDIEYEYVKDKLIDVTIYERDAEDRKQGFRSGAVSALITVLLDSKYKGKIPSHIAYVDNHKKRFNAKSMDCVMEMYCSRVECGEFKLDVNQVVVERMYGPKNKVTKSKAVITKKNVLAAKRQYEENIANNIDATVTVPATLSFPRACLHPAYMDKKQMSVRPTRRYVKQKHANKSADYSQSHYKLQTQQLKQTTKAMRQHGHLRRVQTYGAIAKAKQRAKQKELSRESDNIRTDIDTKAVKSYKENIRYFKRSLSDSKKWLQNRSEMRVMSSIRLRSCMPLEVQIASPQVGHKYYKRMKVVVNEPRIILTDWTSGLMADLLRTQLMQVKDVEAVLEIGNPVRKTKQLLIATSYDETADRRDGGGNLVLSETCAEVPNRHVASNSLSFLDEQWTKLFSMNFYNCADGFMSDDDDTIVLAYFYYLKGAEADFQEYLWSLWVLFKSSAIATKGKDLMLCIAHNNKNTPRRIIRNFKGTGTTKIEIAKRITMDLRLWQYVEKLQWQEKSYKNYSKVIALVKGYKLLTEMETFKLGAKYAIYDDGTTPWDDMKGKLDNIIDSAEEFDEKDDGKANSLLKYIKKLLEEETELDFDINSSFRNEIISCGHCDDIIVAKIDSKYKDTFISVKCEGCGNVHHIFAGSSTRLITIPLYDGEIDVRNIFSQIIVSKKELDDGRLKIAAYWSDPINVSIDITVNQLESEVPNPCYSLHVKSSLAKLFLIVLVAPCCRSKIYSTALNTHNTSAHIELTIADRKRPKEKPVIQEYVTGALNFQHNRAERYELAMDVPDKAPPKPRVSKETAWDKTPGEDKDLRVSLDCFKRRFRLKTTKGACERLRDELDCDFMTAEWLQKHLRHRDVDDPNRQKVMKVIDGLINSRFTSNIHSNIHQQVLVHPSRFSNIFITIDLSGQISELCGTAHKDYYWLKVCRFNVKNSSGSDEFSVDLCKTSSTQQSIPNHTLVCGGHSLHCNGIMYNHSQTAVMLSNEISEVKIDAVQTHKYSNDALMGFQRFSDELNDISAVKQFVSKANKYLLTLNQLSLTTTNVKRLECMQNMSSLDMESLVKSQEFFDIENVVVLEHISSIEKSMEDVVVVTRFFQPMYSSMSHMGVSVPYSMNTQQNGAHWNPSLMMESVNGLSIVMTDSNDSLHAEAGQIALTKRFVNSYIMGYGLIAAERPLGNACAALAKVRESLEALDYKHDDLWQILGDDMNQLVNHPYDWKRQALDLFVNVNIDPELEQNVIEVSEIITVIVGEMLDLYCTDVCKYLSSWRFMDDEKDENMIKIANVIGELTWGYDQEIFCGVISVDLLSYLNMPEVDEVRINVMNSAYSLKLYLLSDVQADKYKETVKWIKKQYKTVKNVNAAWNINSRTWNDIRNKVDELDEVTTEFYNDNKMFMRFVMRHSPRMRTISSSQYMEVWLNLLQLNVESSDKLKEKCLLIIQNKLIKINVEQISLEIEHLDEQLQREVLSLGLLEPIKFIELTTILRTGLYDVLDDTDELNYRQWDEELKCKHTHVVHCIQLMKDAAFDTGFEEIKSIFI